MTEETENKQELTILWVDDNPDAVKKSKNDVSSEFKTDYPDMMLNIIESANNAEAQKQLKNANNNIEIVVTDYNLEETKSGVDILKETREANYATDVLFYTARSTLDSETKKGIKNDYDFVEIIEGKDKIADALTKLLGKHLRRFNDVVFLRGMVISNVIGLELKMNEFLAKYMGVKPDKVAEFHNLIMENSANQISGKRKAIESIVKGRDEKRKGKKEYIKNGFSKTIKLDEFKKFIQSLHDIEKARNQLAHCKPSKDRYNSVVYEGVDVEFNKKGIDTLLKKIRTSTGYLESLTESIKK